MVDRKEEEYIGRGGWRFRYFLISCEYLKDVCVCMYLRKKCRRVCVCEKESMYVRKKMGVDVWVGGRDVVGKVVLGYFFFFI